MTVLTLAADVVREALARRMLLLLLVVLGAGMALLVFALDLEVVEGALAAGRLFGNPVGSFIAPVDVALRPIFQALVYVTFYGGLLFGIVAMADVAPQMLAPGRVELLLSLPVRRWELALGTYLGVVAIALGTTTFAIGGISLILFWKAGFASAAPLLGGLAAVIAFLPIYAWMMWVATLARSTALSAGSGLLLFLLGIVTSDRSAFVGWFRSALTRDMLSWAIAPLPRLTDLARLGAEAAGGEIASASEWWVVAGGALLFAAAALAAACLVVSERDY